MAASARVGAGTPPLPRPPTYQCSRQCRHPANSPADRQGSTPQAPAGEQGVNSQHILHAPHTAPPQVPPPPPPLLPLLPLPPSLPPSVLLLYMRRAVFERLATCGPFLSELVQSCASGRPALAHGAHADPHTPARTVCAAGLPHTTDAGTRGRGACEA